MILEIIFKDGDSVKLGYDGVYDIVHNVGSSNVSDTFHISYVDGRILTVSEFDRYMSKA